MFITEYLREKNGSTPRRKILKTIAPADTARSRNRPAPRQDISRMLKKSVSVVSHRSEAQRTEAYAFASSLSAALLDGLFEHPARRDRMNP